MHQPEGLDFIDSDRNRPRMAPIAWDDFAKVDIRVGRIVEAEDFPKARKPAYQLRIDFGELGVKSSSAQITRYYDKADLVGRLVLAVVNFPPRQIANFFSEVLTLGVVLGDGDIVLVHPERDEIGRSTRLNSSHDQISYAVFCLKKKKSRSYPRGAL